MAKMTKAETKIRELLAQPGAKLVLNRSSYVADCRRWAVDAGSKFTVVDRWAASKLTGQMQQVENTTLRAVWI